MIHPDHLFGGDLGHLRSLVASIHDASDRRRLLERRVEVLVRRLQRCPPTQPVTCGELAEFGSLILQVWATGDLEENSVLPVPELPMLSHSFPLSQSASIAGWPKPPSPYPCGLRSESDPNDPVPQTPNLNLGVPADHRIQRLPGDTPKKGWTDETAGLPVTDSVEIDGGASSTQRLVRDIGTPTMRP